MVRVRVFNYHVCFTTDSNLTTRQDGFEVPSVVNPVVCNPESVRN